MDFTIPPATWCPALRRKQLLDRLVSPSASPPLGLLTRVPPFLVRLTWALLTFFSSSERGTPIGLNTFLSFPDVNRLPFSPLHGGSDFSLLLSSSSLYTESITPVRESDPPHLYAADAGFFFPYPSAPFRQLLSDLTSGIASLLDPPRTGCCCPTRVRGRAPGPYPFSLLRLNHGSLFPLPSNIIVTPPSPPVGVQPAIWFLFTTSHMIFFLSTTYSPFLP